MHLTPSPRGETEAPTLAGRLSPQLQFCVHQGWLSAARGAHCVTPLAAKVARGMNALTQVDTPRFRGWELRANLMGIVTQGLATLMFKGVRGTEIRTATPGSRAPGLTQAAGRGSGLRRVSRVRKF